MFKKTLLGAIVAAGSLMSLVPGVASAQQTAIVSVSPPLPMHEAVPPPRRGYVWAPGHYEWSGNQYVWVRGRWLEARDGYEYREPRWVQRDNGEWHMVGGNWEPRGPWGDRDRDGIANRYDRDDHARNERRAHRFGPNGDIDRDGIRNFEDRDRDGDGVRNRRDRFPDDWRRS